MDREILLRQLVQAEQGVAEGKAFIAKQQQLIVELERDDCHDTAETMRLLEAFLVLQRSREEDRARILDELSEKKANRPYVRPLWVTCGHSPLFTPCRPSHGEGKSDHPDFALKEQGRGTLEAATG